MEDWIRRATDECHELKRSVEKVSAHRIGGITPPQRLFLANIVPLGGQHQRRLQFASALA